ncbi:MAG: hypothetical protein OHK0050_23320 [Roseiflexaceae bacterium]
MIFQHPAEADILAEITTQPQQTVELALDTLVIRSLVNDLPDGGYGLHTLTRSQIRAALTSTPTRLDPTSYRRSLHYWVRYAQRHAGQNGENEAGFAQIDPYWPTLEACANELAMLLSLPQSMSDGELLGWLNNWADALAQYLDYRNLGDAQIRINQRAYQANQFANRWKDASWNAHDIAWIYLQRGNLTEAIPWVEQANTAVAHSQDRYTQAVMEDLRGLVYEHEGQLDQAEQAYQRSLATYQALGNQRAQSATLNDLGDIAHSRKQYQQAEQYYRQALDLAHTLGDQGRQASYLANLGNLAIERQRFAEATEHFRQALALARAVGREEIIAQAQGGMAMVHEQAGRWREALAAAEEALRIREAMQHHNLQWTKELVERLRSKAR